jgi:hypothetical protein
MVSNAGADMSAMRFPLRQVVKALDLQVMPVCKRRSSAPPVLTYLNVRSAPVLEDHHFRLGLT